MELLIEKHRPGRVADCILPSGIANMFSSLVDNDGSVQNMILHGEPGVGKTTVARALAAEKGLDTFFVNMSLHGNMDLLRTEVQQFASTVSLGGSGKLFIGDEFDSVNNQAAQRALRGMIEEFHESCRFVFTCNNLGTVIDPLLSRLVVVDFRIPPEEREELAMAFMKRTTAILEEEGIPFDKEAVASLIVERFPNFRRILNDVQRAYNELGRIDHSVSRFGIDENFNELVGYMRDRKFGDVRRWVGRNSDIDTATLVRRFYTTADELVEKESVPQMILILADYQHRAAFVADHEVNNSAMFAEIMADVRWR